MTIPSTLRRIVLSIGALVLTGAALVAVPATGAGAAANSAAGIGTDAAKNSPLCDPATGRIKIPAYLASVCVKPWKAGADNGGATYRGVTKNKIKVVVYVAPNDVQLNPPAASQPPKNRSTGQNALIQDAILDAQAALDGRYELWGRTIDYEFVAYSGTDEASQRADAVTVAAMKPFAVVSTAGGAVFSTEIARRKILMAWGSGSQTANLAQQPYRFTGQDANLQAKNVATWLGNQIAGRKAQFAGDPAFQKQTRKFGLLYTVAPTSGNDIDLDGFKSELAKHGVPKLAAAVAYTVPADAAQASAAAQEQAPIIVAKMKDAGVTSIILMGSTTIVGPMTKAATANDYKPEWLMTGWAYQELSLFASQYDQDQWAHAFGMSWFAPYATDQAGAVTAENVVNWYWGTDKGTTASGGMPVVYWMNQGIQLAGPKLTPTSFRDGQFAQPGSGGAFQDQVTTQGNKVGDLKLGYPEYALLGPKDFALVWYDPTAKGKGNILGLEQTGNYQYVDGGKRYTLQTWTKGQPKFFEKLPTNVVYYTTSPAKDIPPQYPCTGCPSQGGDQQPANVRAG
ncbi:MAG: hypothetical protein WD296_07525 [Acidimicrobiia bacterium]